MSKIKIKTWLQEAASLLQNEDIESAQLDAELILCNTLKVGREWLVAHSNSTIPASTAREALQRRLGREPLAYIRGFKEFYGREFIVNKHVLIPRPESEFIIEVLKKLPQAPRLILDVGTGSGALAITTSLELPNTSVDACDISRYALTVAKKNAAKLKARVTFFESDLLQNATKKYDVIVANLPYVDRSWKVSPETDFEPPIALFAENGGLQLVERLIKSASHHLEENGVLILEADPRQHDRIINLASECRFLPLQANNFIVSLQKNTS